MFLQLDLTTSRVPTDAEVECDFGDGSKITDKLDSLEYNNDTTDVTWKVAHRYAENGEYNVTCRYERKLVKESSLKLNLLVKKKTSSLG